MLAKWIRSISSSRTAILSFIVASTSIARETLRRERIAYLRAVGHPPPFVLTRIFAFPKEFGNESVSKTKGLELGSLISRESIPKPFDPNAPEYEPHQAKKVGPGTSTK